MHQVTKFEYDDSLSNVITGKQQKIEDFNEIWKTNQSLTTLIHQNSIQEKIKSRLKLGNACYHSVQNLLSSRLLSKT
jgi:hypothetical protein